MVAPDPDHRGADPRAGAHPRWKEDKRRKKDSPGRWYEAWEAESLGQGTIVRLVREALDDVLPEPLADVLERERVEQARLDALVDGLTGA